MIWWIVSLTLILIVGVLPVIVSPALAKTKERWSELAERWATARGIPASLVLAVIHQESRGNENAKGRTNDFGLMQITQPALTDFNKANFKNYLLPQMLEPEKNVEVGSWYLKWIKGFFKTEDWHKILRAYNAGVGRVLKSAEISKDYANSVLAFEKQILT